MPRAFENLRAHKIEIPFLIMCKFTKSLEAEIANGVDIRVFSSRKLNPQRNKVSNCMSAERKKPASSDMVDNSFKELEIKAKKNEITFRDSFWYNFQGNLYRNTAEIKFALQNFTLKRGQKLLELGAGSGRLTMQFLKQGAEIIALDLSKKSLKNNKENSGCQCIQADLCHLPFKPNSFDNIAAMSVFQHVPTEENRNTGYFEVQRVLKADGQFLIDVYNYRVYDNLKKRKEGFLVITSPPIYFYRFSAEELRKSLSSYFEIKDFRAILLFHPLMKRYRIGKMKWLVRLTMAIESLVVRIPLSFQLSDFLVVVCQKARV